MEKKSSKKNRKTVRINGVRIVNAENAEKRKEPPKDATEGTRDLIWLMDKDNLEL